MLNLALPSHHDRCLCSSSYDKPNGLASVLSKSLSFWLSISNYSGLQSQHPASEVIHHLFYNSRSGILFMPIHDILTRKLITRVRDHPQTQQTNIFAHNTSLLSSLRHHWHLLLQNKVTCCQCSPLELRSSSFKLENAILTTRRHLPVHVNLLLGTQNFY